MINFIYTAMAVKLFMLYFFLFAAIIVIKRIRYIQVIINGIWFSVDGSLPESVINNYIQLAEKRASSIFKKNYQIILWTDMEILQPEIKKKLEKHGIKIKDYRDVAPCGEAAEKVNNWVGNFVRLGKESNKLLFAMASDMFRLYLLLKEFPENYRNAISCYMDCNDVVLTKIPHPRRLQKIRKIAFGFVPIEFESILSLFNSVGKSKYLLSNDVIITVNKNNQSLFDEIFKAYYNNLSCINLQASGILELSKDTLGALKEIDQNTALIIAFCTTHIMHTVSQREDSQQEVCLLKLLGDDVKVRQLGGVRNAADFFSFIRNYENGLIWLTDYPCQLSTDQNYDKYYHFWRGLFCDNLRAILLRISLSSS